MAKKVAQITSKIVEFTGNEETSVFIGRPVTMQNTTHGVVYAIGNTGYVLTSQEYKMFVAAGAIAQPSTTQKASKTKAHKQIEITKEDIAKAAAKKETSNGVDINAVIKDEQERVSSEKAQQGATGMESAKYQRILATSSFLQDYQNAEFKMETPKHMGFFDKTEDFGQRITGFFDAIGKKGRDKIIDSMND